jgi:hypothetical protein
MLAFGRSAWATYSAQIAQVVGEVIVAPPWELHAFVVPAAICSRLGLVTRRGRRVLRADRTGRGRCRRGCSLGAPRIRRACRDVLAFGRSARATRSLRRSSAGSCCGRASSWGAKVDGRFLGHARVPCHMMLLTEKKSHKSNG